MTDSKVVCRRLSGAVSAMVLVCCLAFATTDKIAVKKSTRHEKTTTIDIGPAVPADSTEEKGRHGWVVQCDNDLPSCYMPHAGDSGAIVKNISNGKIYPGENIEILWDGRDLPGIYEVVETH
jgi:hypothetical protein